MVLRIYTIDVPDGYSLRCPTFYKKKSMADDYVETRGRPQKEDYDIEIPDKNIDFKSKEKRKYYNRLYYIRKKNGLVNGNKENQTKN